ncbi:MAG: hypothetical protein ABIP55_03160 [Tepidisphaeraceae bacterium]
MVVVVLLGIVLIDLILRRLSGPRPGEIGLASDFKRRYPWLYSRRPRIKLKMSRVPEEFRDLIPLVEKWGIGDDIMRTDLESEATEEEKLALRDGFASKEVAVGRWIDSFRGGEMSNEAAAFMYALEALDEMRL